MNSESERIIAGFEHLEGTYQIENYIFGDHTRDVVPGCWIYGDTVYGDVQIGFQQWATYSVPVMAYLVHVSTVRVPTQVKQQQDISVVEGYSSAFSTSVETDVGLGVGFVGSMAIGVKASSSSTDGIHGSTTRTQKIEMEGPGVFNVYQLHVAYAHCATSAGSYADFFRYAKTLARPTAEDPARTDLYFMTSIATDTIVPVSSENSQPPLSWADIQEAALMQGYDPQINGGMWSIDLGAYDTPGAHY